MESDLTRDFSQLPLKVIARILTFLEFRQCLNAGRTCKSWYYATCDPMITKNIRVEVRRNNQTRLGELHRPFDTLELIYVKFNLFRNYRAFFQQFGPHITALKFKSCDLTLDELIDCLFTTTNLKSFKIMVRKQMLSGNVNLNDEKMNVLKTKLNSVNNFGIRIDSYSEALRIFLSMMPNLKNLSYFFVSAENKCVNKYKNIFDYFNMFTEEVNLDRLTMGNLTRYDGFLNDFTKITPKLNIRELRLQLKRGTSFIKGYDKNFDNFCENRSSVRSLTIQAIREYQLSSICRNMTQLTELNIFGLRSLEVRNIGYLRKLEKLLINYNQFRIKLEDAELLAMIKKLDQLKQLTFEFPISEQVLNQICQTCTKLTSLKLLLQTNKLAMIFKNLSKLEQLKLSISSEQHDFTDDPDCDITNLQHLKKLGINTFVPGITMELIEQLPNLCTESLFKIKKNMQLIHREMDYESFLRIYY